MISIPDDFWFAKIEVSAEDGGESVIVAIDILRRGDTEFVVAISRANEPPSLDLTCYIAFANSVEVCNLASKWGFPVFEAEITYDPSPPGVLRIIFPYIPESESAGPTADTESDDAQAERYESRLLEVNGVVFGYPSGKAFKQSESAAGPVDITYFQSIVGPDRAQPDTESETLLEPLLCPRNAVVQEQGDISLWVAPSREPDLTPPGSTVPPRSKTYLALIWSGSVQYPRLLSGRAPPRKARRTGDAASRAYRFEDVEVLGFRIDLRKFGEETNELLEALIAPLNFQRDGGQKRTAGLADFRYGVGSHTLVIELLRYGKMKNRRKRGMRGKMRCGTRNGLMDGGRERMRGGMKRGRPGDRLKPNDYGSQHELLVRVLVGRLDDDTAQARNPAVFVPAIFVDNPLSKFVGREMQGLNKQLAYFCTEKDDGKLAALLPDGRLRGDDQGTVQGVALDGRLPLARISEVRYVSQLGMDAGDLLCGDLVCGLDLPPAALEDDAFVAIDPALASGRSRLAGVRWRQTDFDAAEFRRSFARPVIADGISGMRSVQVSPIDDRDLEQTWIQGKFAVDRVRLAFPAGIATLTLHDPDTAPEPWKLLYRLLAGTSTVSTDPARIDLPTGDWYRMQLSMDLKIYNGLAW